MRCFTRPKLILTVAISSLLAMSSLSLSSVANPQPENARQGLPTRRISGGSRSPGNACLSTPNQPVIALVPQDNVGLTLTERPTFWFSMPGISQDRTLEFGLFDAAGEQLYQKTFHPSETAGITSITLPETAPSLETEKNYRWYLSVVCDSTSRSEDLVVTGWVRRVDATHNLQQQLTDATEQERLALFESAEIWFDELTALAELRQHKPSNQLDQQWTALFESVGLPQVTNTPFTSEPSPELAQVPASASY